MRTHAEVIKLGTREVISTGQFNIELVADRLIERAINDWMSVSDVARFVYGKPFQANNSRVRKSIWQLRRYLIGRGFLLITEGRPVEYMKLFVAGSEQERQLAQNMLEKMRKRSDFSAELFEKAYALFQSP